jgi:ketosteroid isomerase-like protein
MSGDDHASVEAVLDHHWEAFTTQDLEMVMEDYEEDSVVITHMGTFRGLAEIEGLFSTVFEEFAQAGSTTELEQQTVEGDTAYIVWSGETPDNSYPFATDTFQIRDGVVETQTFGARVEPKAD